MENLDFNASNVNFDNINSAFTASQIAKQNKESYRNGSC